MKCSHWQLNEESQSLYKEWVATLLVLQCLNQADQVVQGGSNHTWSYTDLWSFSIRHWNFHIATTDLHLRNQLSWRFHHKWHPVFFSITPGSWFHLHGNYNQTHYLHNQTILGMLITIHLILHLLSLYSVCCSWFQRSNKDQGRRPNEFTGRLTCCRLRC